MILNAQDYTTFAEAIDAANSLRNTTGCTLYVPGSTTPYDATSKELMYNTKLVGDGYKSQIIGKLKLSSFPGGQEVSSLRFTDGIELAGVRNMRLGSCTFENTVILTGPSYYNTFDTCRWMNLGLNPAIKITDTQNFNRLYGCRINHEGIAIDLRSTSTTNYSNGWAFLNTAFEGAGADNATLGSAIKLEGGWHTIDSCWFEKGGNRKYDPNYTLDFLAKSHDCRVVGNVMGYLVTVRDQGSHNDIQGRYEIRRAD